MIFKLYLNFSISFKVFTY